MAGWRSSAAPPSFLSFAPFTPAVGMVASRSLDGGFSWSVPFLVQPVTADFWDNPVLSADPRRPRVACYTYDLRRPPDYISGYSLLSITTNAGVSWSPARGCMTRTALTAGQPLARSWSTETAPCSMCSDW
jgi:hypothetical protein